VGEHGETEGKRGPRRERKEGVVASLGGLQGLLLGGLGGVTPIPSDILGFPDMGHGPATLGLGVVDSATRREQQDHGGHR
jgi:hypothetical protein